MKVIVTGASGLLGRQVVQELSNEFSVIGTAFTRATGSLFKLNLLDYEQTEEFIKTHNPNIIINCAAERRPDVAENNNTGTLLLNATVCQDLTRLSIKYSFYLIHISTDYVFDGTRPPYKESDEPKPLNFYGKSKLAGEQEILKNIDSAILRVPVLYGPVIDNSESAINILLDILKNSTKSVGVDHHQPRYPTNVLDVAKVLKIMCGCLLLIKIFIGKGIN